MSLRKTTHTKGDEWVWQRQPMKKYERGGSILRVDNIIYIYSHYTKEGLQYFMIIIHVQP